MTYPIIICEDQIIQLNQLETIIQNFILFHNELFEIQLKTQSPLEVTKHLENFQPKQGIYFLDIDLNHTMNGIDLAEEIREKDVQAKIIFITTHDELIPLTMKRRVETLGFVVKDQSLESYRAEIIELLLLAQQRIDATRVDQDQAFLFSIGSQSFTVAMQEIYFVESATLPHRVALRTKSGQYEFYGKLSELAESYPQLFRVSRKCLANLRQVKEFDFKTRKLYFEPNVARHYSIGKASKIKELLKK
ncbi:response regulator transcription factor [Enterococcus sp. CSURQ0835]|uniref:response regulator transcription factor n=1 Tax=Enterococcus sp. CSURQ0835 TaxID=2681394 RepID=UPI00135AB7F6|nr:response regulator transcription factor [Enterococcus sp. CSURQ0835]